MKSSSTEIPDNWIRTYGKLDVGQITTPQKGKASHASTGAVSFSGLKETQVNYIGNLHFVSCASDGPISSSLPPDTRSCLASKH